MSIIQNNLALNLNPIYTPSNNVNHRGLKKLNKSSMRNTMGRMPQGGGSENLITLDFYQNNNLLNQDDMQQP
jgi:hypothetical protein